MYIYTNTHIYIEYCSSCTNLALRANQSHGLIAHTGRVPERNFPAQAIPRAASKNPSIMNTTCINSFHCIHLITCVRL